MGCADSAARRREQDRVFGVSLGTARALAAIRERTEARGRSVAPIPVVMQWNKRDCAAARAVSELEAERNHRCFPSMTASALRDTGVVETLLEILRRTIHAAQRRAGGSPLAEAELGRIVESTMPSAPLRTRIRVRP